MSCRPFEELIALAVGGDLPETSAGRKDQERLDRHLLTCTDCRRFADEMRESHRALRSLADVPIAEEALEAVRTGTQRRLRRSPLPWMPRHRHRALALAASVLVALGAAAWLFRSGSGTLPHQSSPATFPRTVADSTTASSARIPPQEPDIAARTQLLTPSSEGLNMARDPEISESSSIPNRAGPNETTVAEYSASRASDTPVSPRLAATANRADSTTESSGSSLRTLVPTPEPMVIKLISEEADLVIYWLVNPPAEATQETTDELSAV